MGSTIDYAEFLEWVLKEHYADVDKVELVQDNLNTHSYGSFYDHLTADQARVLAQKLNFHFTPKHGSWLNMAEIEFSALVREGLHRRIDSIEKLGQEVLLWTNSIHPVKYIFPDISLRTTFVNKNKSYESFRTDV